MTLNSLTGAGARFLKGGSNLGLHTKKSGGGPALGPMFKNLHPGPKEGVRPLPPPDSHLIKPYRKYCYCYRAASCIPSYNHSPNFIGGSVPRQPNPELPRPFTLTIHEF